MRLTKAILVTLVLLIPAIACGKEVVIGKLKYKVNTTDKIAKCTGLATEATKAYNLVIPSTVVYDNVTLKVTTVEKEAFCWDDYLKKVTLSDYTETIGSNAFSYCDNISIVSLGKKLQIIGKEAFAHCGNKGTFTSITFPATLQIIRDDAFTDCRYLASVTFAGDQVTSIGDYGFWNCESLKSIMLPGSLQSVGEMAFASCESLYEVTFLGGNGKTVIGTKCFDNLKNLTLVNFQDPGVAHIGPSAFIGCAIQWLTIPSTVHTIDEGAFMGNDLTSIDLSEGLKTIGASAFYGQWGDGVKKLTIPSTVTSVGEHAFYHLGRLDQVICRATLPPTAGEEAFDSQTTGLTMLYVPTATVDRYKVANVWRDFCFINGNAGVDDILADDTNEDAEEIWYDMSGHEVSADNIMSGIYIVRKGSSVEKRIVR